MAERAPRDVGGEAPADGAAPGIAGGVPGGDARGQGAGVGDAPREHLAAEDRQLQLGDVEPAAVLGGVVQLKFARQAPRLGGWECGMWRRATRACGC